VIGFKIQIANIRSGTPGGFGLSIGVMPRRILKSVKRYALPLGIVVLALSTACAPVTRTAHVSTVTPYDPKDASQHNYVVNTTGSSGDSASIMASKLEVLFEGQKLSVEHSSYTNHVDPAQSGFSINANGPISVMDMQSEVMASVATDLGIMSELADGGLLLASAANLFQEPETEARTGTRVVNATSASSSLSSGALGQNGAGSSNSSTTNPVIGQGSSIGGTSFADDSDEDDTQAAAPGASSGSAPVVTAPVVTPPVEAPEQDDEPE
jgi:hypothetical protein